MRTLIKSRKAIVAVVAVVLFAAGRACFGVPLISGKNGIGGVLGADVQSASMGDHAEDKLHDPGMMYPMKERVVNISNGTGLHYVKIELVLEFDMPDAKGLKGEAYKKRQDEFAKEMASRRPMLDDIVTTVLAGKTMVSLSSLEGKEALRDELKNKFGQIAGEHKLLNVYFTQFIIQ